MELANTVDKGRLIDETQVLKKTEAKDIDRLALSLILGLMIPYVSSLPRGSLKKIIESEIDLKTVTKGTVSRNDSRSGTR